jgi:hypothetical protein
VTRCSAAKSLHPGRIVPDGDIIAGMLDGSLKPAPVSGYGANCVAFDVGWSR